jgi:hypothetical protein
LPVKALTIFVIEYGFQIGLSVPVYHKSLVDDVAIRRLKIASLSK